MLQRPHTPPHQRAPLSVGAQVSTHHSRIPGLPEHLWLFRWASTPCCPIAGRRAGHPAADRWALQGLRTDLPQVGAMAVTRDGVPVRCWTFAGNIADTAIIRIVVKDDLGGWNLHRMAWGTDRGFASTATGLPDLRRRAPHPRRKAPHHQLRGRRRRARLPRPLPHRRRQPARQGSLRRPGEDDDGARNTSWSAPTPNRPTATPPPGSGSSRTFSR